MYAPIPERAQRNARTHLGILMVTPQFASPVSTRVKVHIHAGMSLGRPTHLCPPASQIRQHPSRLISRLTGLQCLKHSLHFRIRRLRVRKPCTTHENLVLDIGPERIVCRWRLGAREGE